MDIANFRTHCYNFYKMKNEAPMSDTPKLHCGAQADVRSRIAERLGNGAATD
jgi:hypothetical protein